MISTKNVNEQAFDLLREYLFSQAAPQELHEALDGLRLRYEIGRDVQRERLELWRADRERLTELEKE